MPRKPNYRFERFERERTRAAKKAERAKIKAERAEQAKPDAEGQAEEGHKPDEPSPQE